METTVAKRQYVQATDGEWIQPSRKDFRMRCCDCKLVHIMDFRIRDGRVQFKPTRDVKATAASRRTTSPILTEDHQCLHFLP